MTGHLIIDANMGVTCKARWVLDIHKKSDPVESIYTGVGSHESVKITITYTALNDLDIFTDHMNVDLQAPSSQKDYIICGPEFGLENLGKVTIVH